MANKVLIINEKNVSMEIKDDSIVASLLAIVESSASSLTVQSALPVAKATLAKIDSKRHSAVKMSIENEKLTFSGTLETFDKFIENHEFLLKNVSFVKNQKVDSVNKFAESLKDF